MAATVAACLLLASCTTEDPTPTPTASATSLGRSGVTSPDGWEGTVTIAAPPASAPLLTDTKALLDAGLLVGMPLEITADQALPAQGLTITRTYPVPLGADMASTLAFFNDDAGGWQAVPSILSPDRRTVSAVVTHLSVWNDIVAGTQQSVSDFRSAAGDAVRAGSELSASALSAAGAKLADVADWMYYAVGKVFDTRVDAPVCEADPPSWVREVVFIEDHRNNSIRFCSGYDGAKPDLLVVKARVNRGFAFAAKPAVKTAWQYNSSETTGLWDAVLPWLKANDEALRDTLLEVTGGDPRLAVGAGQELSLGLSEKDTRALKGSTVLELQPPDALLFLYSLLGQLIMQDIGLKDTSALTTALALSSCISSVAEADRDDPLKIAKAVLVCLQSQSETITKLTVRIMTETGRDAAETLSTSRVLTRASIYLALIGPVFSTMNWVAETQTLKNARTIDVFPTTAVEAPEAAGWVMSLDGVGNAKVGMPMSEFAAALGGTGLDTEEFETCGQGGFTAGGVSFGILSDGEGTSGPVQSVTVGRVSPGGEDRQARVATAEGIHIGSGLRDVLAAYPSAEVEPSEVAYEWQVATVFSSDRTKALVFDIDENDTVAGLSAGLVPQVLYPEGCA